jgi:hypothetical protein
VHLPVGLLLALSSEKTYPSDISRVGIFTSCRFYPNIPFFRDLPWSSIKTVAPFWHPLTHFQALLF